ncbi:MAG TPA: hypothetical protein VNL97_02300 [Solirubrobacterales bacterium]|nr:hypothetical protein [Solirubrobacterales bacterium]
MVALEGWSVPVKGVAIRFDNHPLGSPQEVDQETLYKDIHLGDGQVSFAAEGQEIDLQRRASVDSAGVDERDHARQATGSASPRGSLEQAHQLVPTNVSLSIGGDEHPLELPRPEPRSHIEKSPLDRSDWNPEPHGALCVFEHTRLVQVDPSAGTAARAPGYLGKAHRLAYAP